MIKISYPRLIEIAMTIGYDPKDDYNTLLNILREHGIEVTTQAIPPGYILTFTSENYETVFRIKYSEILDNFIFDDSFIIINEIDYSTKSSLSIYNIHESSL